MSAQPRSRESKMMDGLKLLLPLCVLQLACAQFRGGSISWEPVSLSPGDNVVRFTVRRSLSLAHLSQRLALNVQSMYSPAQNVCLILVRFPDVVVLCGYQYEYLLCAFKRPRCSTWVRSAGTYIQVVDGLAHPAPNYQPIKGDVVKVQCIHDTLDSFVPESKLHNHTKLFVFWFAAQNTKHEITRPHGMIFFYGLTLNTQPISHMTTGEWARNTKIHDINWRSLFTAGQSNRKHRARAKHKCECLHPCLRMRKW